MSSIHFEVENFGDSAEVRDRRSTNRTWLNNSRVTSSLLTHGDRLRAGKTIMAVEIEQSVIVLPEQKIVLGDSAQAGSGSHDSDDIQVIGVPRSSKKARPAAAAPTRVVAAKAMHAHGPIESSSLATDSSEAPSRAVPTSVASNSPISESGSWFTNPPKEQGGRAEARLLAFERVGDFQIVHNLRIILNTMRRKRAICVIANFSKIHMTTPTELQSAKAVYPDYPGALTHLPVTLTWHDWESRPMQTLATRLCGNDGLMVLFADPSTDLQTYVPSIGNKGVPGFCEPGGFLNWSCPSAFLTLVQCQGLRLWGDTLGKTIDGAMMYLPNRPNTLIAYATNSLGNELQACGFVPAPVS